MYTTKNIDIIREIKYIQDNLPNIWNKLFLVKGNIQVCPYYFGLYEDNKPCGCKTCEKCWELSYDMEGDKLKQKLN